MDEIEKSYVDTVDEYDQCPKCGENRKDGLCFVNDYTIRCETCGEEYSVF